jgi:hypothetical protein
LWYVPLVVVAGLAGIPVFGRWIDGVLERVRRPSDRTRAIIAVGIWVVATGYLVFTGFYQGRDFVAKLHDENMYLLQTQMLARGMLWMRQHPVADSFETFHVFVKPVYAAIYFPGTALVLTPGVWLGLKFWVIPAIVCGAAVGLLYRVVAELLDGVSGILAALLLLSLTEFRYVSLTVMSHGMMVFWGLALVWAWLKWRRAPTVLWAVVIGVIAGWAAITRPIDALCYAIPVGVAMLWAMRGWSWSRRGKQWAAVVVAAVPFLMLQGILDWGVTGKWWSTPDHLYNELYTPGVAFGFQRFDPSAKPASSLLQRVKYYKEFTVPAAEAHQPEKLWENWTQEKLPRLAKYAIPSVLLLILIPVSLLALTRQRGVLAGTVLLFIGAYMMFAYLLTHYVVVAAPGIILLVLMGVRAVEETFPRWRASVAVFATMWIGLLCLRAMPEFNRFVRDDWYAMETMRFNAKLESKIEGRAIVLYHFGEKNNPHEEPVYNVKAAWPDDARVIRAHDLGEERNRKLFEYYVGVQPDRRVYWVDRVDGRDGTYDDASLHYLGTVRELADTR